MEACDKCRQWESLFKAMARNKVYIAGWKIQRNHNTRKWQAFCDYSWKGIEGVEDAVFETVLEAFEAIGNYERERSAAKTA